MTSYGLHLCFDLNACEPDHLRDGEYLYRFLLDLVDEIGMKAMGSPHLDLYTGPHKEWDGFSATVHIQTSHITCHVFAFGYVFLDIFSCMPFDVQLAAKFVTEAWRPKDGKWQVITRGENFPAHLLGDPNG